MSTGKKTVIKKIRKKRKKLHWAFKALLGLFLFLVIVQLLLLYFANPILKSTVKSYVREKSGGLYSIDFERISVNLRTRSIRLDDFKLTPHKNKYDSLKAIGQAEKALYAINFAEFHIRSIEVYKLWKSNDLDIEKVRLVKPLVRIVDLPPTSHKRKDKYDAVHRDLYPAISRFLNSLRINTIEIQKGYFDFFIQKEDSRISSTANNISIELTEFYLDEETYKRRDKLFYSESIEASIKDYVLGLKDNIHVLRAGEVVISSRKSQIKVKKVSLRPEQVQERYMADIDADFNYVFVPEINITNTNIKQVYFNNILNIEKVQLLTPKIKVIKNKKRSLKDKAKEGEFTGVDLYSLIEGKLKSVSIQLFTISESSMKMFKTPRDAEPTYTAGSLSILMERFQLDSNSYKNKTKILYADDIDLTILDYHMRLKDKIHELHAEKLMISTDQSKIFAENVSLKPNYRAAWQKNKRRTLYSLSFPRLQINGADLHRAYNFADLPVAKLLLLNPQMNVNRYEQLRKKDRKKTKSKNNIYQLVSYYLNSLTINKIELRDGHFDFSNFNHSEKVGYSNGKVNLLLNNFRLEPGKYRDGKKLFNAEDIRMIISDYSMKTQNNLHLLTVNEIGISTAKPEIYAQGIRLKPLPAANRIRQLRAFNKSSYFDAAISKLVMKQADISQVYFDRKLQIHRITIANPKVNVVKYSNIQPVTVDELSDSIQPTDSIKVVKERLTGETEDKEIIPLIDTLEISPESIFNEYKMKEMLSEHIELIDIKKVNLQSGKFSFVSKDTLNRNNLQLENEISGELTGFYLNINITKQEQDSILHSQTRQAIDSLQNFTQTSAKDSAKIEQLTLQLDSLQKILNSNINENRILFSRDIEIKLRNNKLIHKKNTYDISAKEIGLSTGASKIEIKDISIKPKQNMADSLKMASLFTIKIPNFRLEGIDIRKTFSDNSLNVKNIVFDKPDIQFLKRPQFAKKQNNGFSMLKSRLEIPLPKSMQSIHAEHIWLDSANLHLQSKTESGVHSFANGQLSIDLYDFNLDTISLQSEEVPFVNHFTVSLHDFSYKLPDSIHTVKSGELHISSLDSVISVQDFVMSYDTAKNYIEALQRTKKNGLLSLKVNTITTKGIDINSYYSDKKLRLQSLNLHQPEIVYRTFKQLRSNKKKRDFKLENIDFYPAVSRFSKSLQIDSIMFDRAKITLERKNNDSINKLSLDNISGEISRFSIDSIASDSTKKKLYSENVILKINDFRRITKDSLYEFSVEEIALSYSDSLVYLYNYRYKPRYDRLRYGRMKGFQIPVYNVEGQNIELDGFNIEDLIENQQVKSRKLLINNLYLNVFKDRRLPLNTDKYPPMPQEIIKNLGVYINFDSIQVQNSEIEYEDYGPNSLQTGKIGIERINGLITNVTNDSVLIENNPSTQIDVKAELMGNGSLLLHIDMPLNAPQNEHTIEGVLHYMRMRDFNRYLENSQFISIEDGNVKKLYFWMEVNDTLAEGIMRFRYHDLSITFLDEETGKEGTGQAISGFFANTLLRSDNPKPGGLLREGAIYTIRDPHRPFVHHWISALLSGIKSTFGFESKEFKYKIKKERKLKRKVKKERRKQRREERKRLRRLRKKLKERKQLREEMQREKEKRERKIKRMDKKLEKEAEKEKKHLEKMEKKWKKQLKKEQKRLERKKNREANQKEEK